MQNSDKHPLEPEPLAGTAVPYTTGGGGQIFRIPVKAFPGLWGYVYLVLVDNYRVLIDTGSGFGESNQHLEAGLASASIQTGEDTSLSSLTHILVTHGHIDHFGGLNYVRPRSSAKLGIHELDKRVVTNHAERLSIIAHRLEEFLTEAGVSPDKRSSILDMYRITKSIYQSTPVEFTYGSLGMRMGPFEMLHVPGHCPGHVVIRLHDVLFCGDHVLSDISPHQAPERLSCWTGLGHYLQSLEALRPWSKDVHLALGGHENPMTDLAGRLDAIRALHMERLQMVLDILKEPHTIADLSKQLFGTVNGYNILLALEETGAHVEYLYQQGILSIDNLKDLEQGPDWTPVRYRCSDCKLD